MSGHNERQRQGNLFPPIRIKKPMRRITALKQTTTSEQSNFYDTRSRSPITVRINDSGLGMSFNSHKNMHPALFSLQYQKPTTMAQQQGSLGPLTLVKEAVTFDASHNSKSKELYFVPSGDQNVLKHKKKEVTKSAPPATMQGPSSDITNILMDVPNAELFEFFLSKDFQNPKERHSILSEQLLAMVAKARKVVIKPEFLLNTYIVLRGHGVAEIYYWCKALEVNTGTFFRSLELFDRFCVLFNDEMAEPYRQMDAEGKTECKKRMRLQKSLRICSCILLASKIHSDLSTPTITLDMVKKALAKEKHAFSITAIAESELRVFRVLKYQTHWVTPFDLTEQMISVLNIPCPNTLSRFYSIAMLYLKFCYVKHAEFYKKVENVHQNQSSKNPKMTSEQFKRLIEHNIPLRSAAIVAATGFHIDDQFHSHVSKQMSAVTGESEDCIASMALLLCDLASVVTPDM